jgi:hypothetical protein
MIKRTRILEISILLYLVKITMMAEGYTALAEEHKSFALMASKIEHEIMPEWK